jgi:hypothetical protein
LSVSALTSSLFSHTRRCHCVFPVICLHFHLPTLSLTQTVDQKVTRTGITGAHFCSCLISYISQAEALYHHKTYNVYFGSSCSSLSPNFAPQPSAASNHLCLILSSG